MIAFAYLAGAAAVAVSVAEDARLIEAIETANKGGRNAAIFGAQDPERAASINRASCAALTSIKAVQRAGAYESKSRDDIAQLGSDIPIIETSGSLVPELYSAPVVIGADLTDLPAGTRLRLSSEVMGTVDAIVAERAHPSLALDAAVSVAAGRGETSSGCAVVFSRWINARDLTGVTSAALTVSGGAIAASTRQRDAIDPLESYHDRPTKWIWLLLGLIGGALGATVARFRAPELASYRLAGTGRFQLVRILALEQTLVTGVFFTATIQCMLISGEKILSPTSLLLNGLSGASLWMAAFCCLVWLGVPRNALLQSRDG